MRNISHAEERLFQQLGVLRKQIEHLALKGAAPTPAQTSLNNHQQMAMRTLKLLNQSGELKDVIMCLFKIVREDTGIEAVGVRLHNGEDYPYFSANGFPQSFVELENHLCRHGPDGRNVLDASGNPRLECMCGNVIMKRTDSLLPFFTEYGSFWTNSTSALLTSGMEKYRQAMSRNLCTSEGYESIALIPLYADKEIIGLLQLNDKRADCFSLDTIQFFEGIGAGIGITFRSQQSIRQGRKALEGSIRTIASLVEARDPYTAGHQRRVADLARAVATEMGLSTDQIEGIKVAGSIHDIGKISVPAEILSKSMELTAIEFKLIKTHVRSGYDILKDMEFPWPVARIILEHHERMNGSGYPNGLNDGQILLESRIVAVADVVDAIASHRPYRPALGIEAALEEIKDKKGIIYDHRTVDACIKVFKEGYKWEA